MNAKYMYPHGNLSDISPLPFGLTPDPIWQEVISQSMGKDVFTKNPLSNSDILGIPGTGRVRHVAETFLPRPVRSGFKVLDATIKNPSSSTSPSTLDAIIQELGVPYFEYNPTEGAKYAQLNKNTAIKDILSAQRSFIRKYNGRLPTWLYQQINNHYQNKLREVGQQ